MPKFIARRMYDYSVVVEAENEDAAFDVGTEVICKAVDLGLHEAENATMQASHVAEDTVFPYTDETEGQRQNE